jgi:hypothetical protein
MTEPCEICESLAVATSSCPATDVIMVLPTVASASSVTQFGTSPQGVLVSAAQASDATVIDAYALMINVAQASDEVSPTLVITGLVKDGANGSSTALQFIEQAALSVAHAEDSIAAADVPVLVSSAAEAISSMEVGTVANYTLDNKAEATSQLGLGLLEVLTSTAATQSSVIILRRVEAFVTSTGDAQDDATASSENTNPSHGDEFLLLSVGNAVSIVSIQTDHMMYVGTEVADAKSSIWYKDPDAKAWVLNTESTAVSWYDNFQFESIATNKAGKTLAIGPDGLYELDGDTDNGERVDATVESGFVDWSSEQIKRLDNMYFGYTSEGRISVQAEVLDSGHPPSTYYLEERAATAPRNSRVTPGKGLWGRYWRLTIKNVDGADFEVHDASVDIAVSSRRI